MCKACDLRANALLKSVQPDLDNSFNPAIHFAAATGKADDGMIFTGHDLVPPQVNTLIITADAQPGDRSTTTTLTVNGPKLVSTIEAPNDEDFFSVTLEAGKTYEIGQYLTTSGPNKVGVADAFLEVYDASGKLIVSADGGGPNTPSGLDALLSFTPETSGVFYINARSYDQDSTNGSKGDFVGDYEIFVKEGNAFTYKPYYDVDNPLYALDWGTQVDGSSRNPDGAEGPRPTGNEFTGHAYNPFGITGKNVIYYYFAKQGEAFVSEDPANPGLENMVAAGFRDWEKRAYEQALDEYEKVADIVYIEVQDRNEADFIFITYDGTPNVGVLGRMSPPDTQNEGQTEFNRNGPGWNETALKPGGFSFQTLMHELGHGHGLSHPHDNGGRSGILNGVFEEGTFDYSTGDFNLNQGIHTIMSYEDGWRPKSEAKSDTDGDGTLDAQGLRPDGHGAPPTSASYGWVATLSPFDIAVIQEKYGVNEEYATGNDTYVLKDANVDGTFYSAIWDAGGSDSIVYDGARDATIDLRAATLKYEFGGGGFVSFALGIHGGYTIANGVVIEEARSGSGNDTLNGNDIGNLLNGNTGNDTLAGNGGADGLTGHWGDDRLDGGADNDELNGGNWDDLLFGGDGDDILLGAFGNDKIDGGSGTDTIVLSDTLSDYFVVPEGDGFRIIGRFDTDIVTNVEKVQIGGVTMSFADFSAQAFDGLRYIAGFEDLRNAFGANAEAGRQHYLEFGKNEGRAVDGFDPIQYGASYSDLIRVFGTDTQSLSRHFIDFGDNEGRTTKFDATRYGEANGDLLAAFGDDEGALAWHFIQFGFGEGRAAMFVEPPVA